MTRAIIEGRIDNYHYRVRIPIINKLKSSVSATPTEELAIATIAAIPGCSPKFRNGDIVFVEFEERDTSKPVIVGRLYNTDDKTIASDANFDSLVANVNVELPVNTTIGKVTKTNILYLEGLNSNVQYEFDKNNTEHQSINDNIDEIEENIDDIEKNIDAIEVSISEILQQISTIQQSIATINTTIASIQSDITNIKQKDSQQDTQIAALSDRLVPLENQLSGVMQFWGKIRLNNASYGTSEPSGSATEGQIYLYIQ